MANELETLVKQLLTRGWREERSRNHRILKHADGKGLLVISTTSSDRNVHRMVTRELRRKGYEA